MQQPWRKLDGDVVIARLVLLDPWDRATGTQRLHMDGAQADDRWLAAMHANEGRDLVVNDAG
jgi:hypothetical protein